MYAHYRINLWPLTRGCRRAIGLRSSYNLSACGARSATYPPPPSPPMASIGAGCHQSAPTKHLYCQDQNTKMRLQPEPPSSHEAMPPVFGNCCGDAPRLVVHSLMVYWRLKPGQQAGKSSSRFPVPDRPVSAPQGNCSPLNLIHEQPEQQLQRASNGDLNNFRNSK